MQRPIRKTALAAAAGALILAAAGPLALFALWSFARGWYWPALLPREWSLRAWAYAASPSAGIPEALAMSAAIALAVTVLALAVALPAARGLAYHDFPGKRIALFLLLLPALTPSLAAAMGAHSLFLRYGLADSAAGVVLVHLIPAVPYAVLVLASSFSSFDTDWEAQARTLGASRTQTWLHVTLPSIAPGLAAAAAFAFLISWSQYLTTLLVGGGRIMTLPLTLVVFQRSGDDSVTAALSLIFLAPAMGVFLLVARFLRNQP